MRRLDWQKEQGRKRARNHGAEFVDEPGKNALGSDHGPIKSTTKYGITITVDPLGPKPLKSRAKSAKPKPIKPRGRPEKNTGLLAEAVERARLRRPGKVVSRDDERGIVIEQKKGKTRRILTEV